MAAERPYDEFKVYGFKTFIGNVAITSVRKKNLLTFFFL